MYEKKTAVGKGKSGCCFYGKKYVRCEMTPASSGGEEQIGISGGSQSHI